MTPPTIASTSSGGPPVVIPASGKNIIVNKVQVGSSSPGSKKGGNELLNCIRNVGWETGDILADFQVGRTTGVLYLSLKYHRLHPEYIYDRIEKLGHSYNLRILLILCDITEHKDCIRELTKACLVNNVTIIVAFSLDEAGHYLSTFKQFEFKSPDLIKERTEKDYHSVLRAALTSIPKVNKTDVETLRSSFGSFAKISHATTDQLQNLPGFGQVKVKNVKNAFDKPFRNNATSTLASASTQKAPLVAPTGTNPTSTPSLSTLPQPAGAATTSPAAVGVRGAPNTPDTTTSGKSTSTRGELTRDEPPRPARPPRPPSPDWDIELDLDPDLDEGGSGGQPPPPQQTRANLNDQPRPPPAPRPTFGRTGSDHSIAEQQDEFDIELDLN